MTNKLMKSKPNNQRGKFKVKTFKEPFTILQGLNISQERMIELDNYLKETFVKNQYVSDAFKEIWNNKSLSNEEVAICFWGIGRESMQREFVIQSQDILKQLQGGNINI